MSITSAEPIGKPSIALIGECMIELREIPGEHLTRGYGGDALNTAIYLSRLIKDQGEVRFITVMGDDPFSTEMISAWADDGIICDAIGRKQGSNAGLYLIQTDDTGERSFHYWRNHSPARELMNPNWAAILDKAFRSSWIYLSGITMAILDDAGREQMLTSLNGAHEHGSTIAFDGNYRPSLWPDHEIAKSWYERLWKLCGLALASAEDEANLFGDASPEATLERLRNYGIPEVVVKRGADPVLLANAEAMDKIPVQPVDDIIDTTAAGDSFNAGYINARICGLAPAVAARTGCELAAKVIQHSGAIIPPSAMQEPIFL